nr:MAG TPA: hypothetical protein [Caudoviricetes sp.]
MHSNFLCASRLDCHTINQSATCHLAVHCPTVVFSEHFHSL